MTTGDSSTIYDLLQYCPRCRQFPKVTMGRDSVAVNCETVGCSMALDRQERVYFPTLDKAIEKWNSFVLMPLIKPAVIQAMVNAGLYKMVKRAR